MTTIGVSLDLAPTHTGLVVWHDEEPVYHCVYTAKTPLEMAHKTTEWLREIAPDWVAIEDCYYGKNIRNFGQTKWLVGWVEGWCSVIGPRTFAGMTTAIDSACGITHKGRKLHIRNLATMILPDEKLSEDECDAIAVGIWGFGVAKTLDWGNLDKPGKV